MGDLRKNFNSEEFDCKCGCGLKFKVDEALLDLLQSIRDKTAKALTLTSACRCRSHNANTVGAAQNSWHVPRDSLYELPILHAADVTYADPELRTAEGIYQLFVYASMGKAKGLGLYRNRIHIDTRPKKRIARWLSGLPQ